MKVMPYSSRNAPRRWTRSARNGGKMWRSRPESHGNSALPMSPCAECVGSRQSVFRKCRTSRLWRRANHRARKERCVWTTPFGWPVVPEVKRISASWSIERRAPGGGAAAASSRWSSDIWRVWAPSAERAAAISPRGASIQRENLGLAVRASTSISNRVSRWSIGMTQPPRVQIASRSTKNSRVFP